MSAIYYCVKNDANFESKLIKKSKDGFLGSYESDDEYELGCARVKLTSSSEFVFLLTIRESNQYFLSLFSTLDQVFDDIKDHFGILNQTDDYSNWCKFLCNLNVLGNLGKKFDFSLNNSSIQVQFVPVPKKTE